MQIYNPLFIVPIITGPLILIIMLIVKKFPPKLINSFYGYRTKQSMSNQDKWDFAQLYSNKLLIRYSVIYTTTAILGLIFTNINSYVQLVLALAILILFLSIPIVNTERKLKEME